MVSLLHRATITSTKTSMEAFVRAGDDDNDRLWTAAFDGHTAVVYALVSAGADVNLQCNDGSSPLTVASQEGHIDWVRLLIEHGAEVDTRDDEGATPLYMAAMNGRIEVVEFLIEQYADVNACLSIGESCLWSAAFHGDTTVVCVCLFLLERTLTCIGMTVLLLSLWPVRKAH